MLWILAALCFCALNSHPTAALRLQDHQQISHHKYYLGRHRSLHGYAFVHYHHKDGPNRTTTGPGPGWKAHHLNKRQLGSPCTAPISDGARWRVSEGYYVHTRNNQGLSEPYVLSTMARAMDAWRCVLGGTLGLSVIGPRIGVRRNTPASTFPIDRPTGENEIGFGPIEGRPGTVAVTVVWGVFGGPVAAREIREFKMRFDEEHYRFGNASLSGVFMDLEAIATHECGHAHGLDDIYLAPCGHVTMFGTSRNGETKKRTLAAEDASGILGLYQ